MLNSEKASFNCNKEVLDNFRRTVAKKYGRLYGVLETEFTAALNDRTRTLILESQNKEVKSNERKKISHS